MVCQRLDALLVKHGLPGTPRLPAVCLPPTRIDTLCHAAPNPCHPRSFTAEWKFWDELRTEELKPGGADIPVTNDNRQVGGGNLCRGPGMPAAGLLAAIMRAGHVAALGACALGACLTAVLIHPLTHPTCRRSMCSCTPSGCWSAASPSSSTRSERASFGCAAGWGQLCGLLTLRGFGIGGTCNAWVCLCR